MNSFILITTTSNSLEEITKIQEELLEKHLISCGNISKIQSSYHWKGKIVKEEEYLLKMKTRKECYKEIETYIKENHSYKVPQIVYYNIEGGSIEYLKWIESETKNKEERNV